VSCSRAHPRRLEQVDDKGQAVNASARQIIYQPAADIIELLGNVVIEQPQGNLTGERITYHLGTGRIQADGQGGRVSMRMNPKPAKTDSGAE
jgi:lipopolysaccharide export system protein LptA